MAIYRGAGGAGDAVGDASSEVLLALAAKDAAQAAQAAAELAQIAAETAETNAETAQAAAASSASAASTSATNAAASASTATTQATNATSSASAASTSASNASTSATNAANSASSASTSATNASNSASAASTSATNAANSATSAANSATAAAASAASINLSSIAITGGTINGATIGATTASTGKFTTLEATGVTTVQAGTVSLPAITTTGDTNTGIFFPAADTIAFTEGGAERMRIDSSGNVGIGTSSPRAPLAFAATTSTAGVPNKIRLFDDGVSNFYGFGISSGLLDIIGGTGGGVAIYTNGANERMRIDSSGNVGIGVSAPTRLLHIDGGASATYFQMTNTASGRTNADGFQIAQDGTAVELINRENGYMGFNTSNTERMRIDSSGNLAIGRTSSISYKLDVDAGAGSAARLLSNNAQVLIGFNSTSFNYYDADTQIFRNNAGTERMRIDSAGLVGIGCTPVSNLQINASSDVGVAMSNSSSVTSGNRGTISMFNSGTSTVGYIRFGAVTDNVGTDIQFANRPAGGSLTERMRITSAGNVLFNGTTTDVTQNMMYYAVDAANNAHLVVANTSATDNLALIYCNRQTSDGKLMEFRQNNNAEGTISVSGTTVSYNGGHLSRSSQLPSNQKDDALLKGTVMSNLDDMCVWVKDGEELPNEQLNKMKVSDVEGDTNVAGVFVNWTRDEDCNSDDMNVAMTGDMIIRIADGVVVQKGDLLMSAGDGTAKPQGDDIVRSKTIAKVTSNHVTCTYADGSYCVPCVLMAC